MPSSFFDSIDDLPVHSQLPDMDRLLSATSYPHTSSNVLTSDRRRDTLYGGIVPAVSSESDDSEVRPKKRSKSDPSKHSDYVQDAPRRQRGRPKVSTKDETAAERRRTQIRLAQRAYRNRKENTITDLTQRVEKLQASMKALNDDFARLRENLIGTGMAHHNSTLVQQVDEMMLKITEALESTPSDAEKSSEGEDNEGFHPSSTQHEGQLGAPEALVAPMTLQGQIQPASSRPAVDIHGNLLGVDTDLDTLGFEGQSLTDVQSFPALPTNYPTSSVSKIGQSESRNLENSKHQQALMSLDRFSQKPLYTYSFQETTFARRLHRLCLERAFRRLTSPGIDNDWIWKTFRFTFNFSNKDRIIGGIKKRLAHGINEPLENWTAPFIHVGGAGLHFPRYDINGQPFFPPNLIDPVRAATTWRIPQVATQPTAENLQHILETEGFDGEWYDCHDVEEYLKTKGIFPDPQSSFALVDASFLNQPATGMKGRVGTITSASSPQSHNSGQISQGLGSNDALVSPTTANEIDQILANTGTNPTIDNAVDNWLGQQGNYGMGDFNLGFEDPMLEVASQPTRLVTIEIEKLLERLAEECACLGRAPGFRKVNVDNALSLAIQEAF